MVKVLSALAEGPDSVPDNYMKAQPSELFDLCDHCDTRCAYIHTGTHTHKIKQIFKIMDVIVLCYS